MALLAQSVRVPSLEWGWECPGRTETEQSPVLEKEGERPVLPRGLVVPTQGLFCPRWGLPG